MAALAVLAATTATFVLLLAGFVIVSFTIKRVDKRGSLREQAPTVLDHGILVLTGAHAARWERGAIS